MNCIRSLKKKSSAFVPENKNLVTEGPKKERNADGLTSGPWVTWLVTRIAPPSPFSSDLFDSNSKQPLHIIGSRPERLVVTCPFDAALLLIAGPRRHLHRKTHRDASGERHWRHYLVHHQRNPKGENRDVALYRFCPAEGCVSQAVLGHVICPSPTTFSPPTPPWSWAVASGVYPLQPLGLLGWVRMDRRTCSGFLWLPTGCFPPSFIAFAWTRTGRGNTKHLALPAPYDHHKG